MEPEVIEVETTLNRVASPEPIRDPIYMPEEEIHYEDEIDANERNVQVRGRGRPRLVRTGSRGRPRRQFHLVDLAVEPNEINSVNEYKEIGHLAEIPIESAI
jgi:hypothetical protein